MSDRVSGLPGLEQRIDDLGTVMDDAKMDRAALLGISEGGPLAALFAATYPDRCRALVLFGSFARGVPRGKELDWVLNYIEQSWGSGGAMRLFAPSCQDDPVMQDWWGRWERGCVA